MFAPFKAQNMSLNSYMTRDGGRWGGRRCCRPRPADLEPDVRMNPVLLKPNSETGSRVIVLGKPVGNMSVGQYIRCKAELFETYAGVRRAGRNRAGHGAGGRGRIGEVNLKAHDVVNMRMARRARAKVLLAGGIIGAGCSPPLSGPWK